MVTVRSLVENKEKLDYQALCKALMDKFGVSESPNWESVMPRSQQQELFGGEVLGLIENHKNLAGEKEIRVLALKRGSISQMLFFYVCLSNDSIPKKQIEQITKKFKKGPQANRYIVWFFGNKKSSALKVVLSSQEGKKIVLKTLPFAIEQPYFKTYDFILSEVAANVHQMFVEPIDLWKALWKAFNISIVNRNFYGEIRDAFDTLLVQISGKGNPFKNEEDRVQFAIRLIGRIIFCWFLRKKGIITDEAVSSSAVLKVNNNYYHELLEPLFFEVMNKPEKERISGLRKEIAKYPFLNGGLFDAIPETDFYDADKSTPDFRLQITNDWFQRFFSFTLEKYNFTVDENSSSNEEIAIDPEMLGRIFENLLAEVNPDTGETARKATGSFYTPRDIVDYMVEQSIAKHLITALSFKNSEASVETYLFGVTPNQQLKIPDKISTPLSEALNIEIEDFVHTAHFPDELDSYAQQLLESLSSIKVLDPACGSGAYPIAVLQKLVSLKHEILMHQDPKKQQSKDANYKVKLETIQNSIFGVDIQPMAVELSRLRCWLSLVVDEENDNIKSLPNLEFKFVCANTLIRLPNQATLGTEVLIGELKTLREQFFVSNGKTKKGIEESFQKVQRKINQQFLEWSGKSVLVDSLAAWKPFDNHKTDWFDPFWMYGIKDGFDIVIGNPPYISLQRISDTKALKAAKYDTYENTGDLYSLFYEQGNKLLKSYGVLCFITSNKWINSNYGKSTRKYFATQTNPLILIDFAKVRIFESATVFVNIILTQKAKNQNCLYACTIEGDKIPESDLGTYFKEHKFIVKDLDENIWKVNNAAALNINNYIEKKGTKLKDWQEVNFYAGIKAGFNDAYHIQEAEKDRLIKVNRKNAKIIKPLLRGKDIKRWKYEFDGWYIINAHNGLRNNDSMKPVNIPKDYPEIFEHFKKYETELKARGDQRNHWTNLRDCAFILEFEKPKIVWIEISDRANYAYDEDGMFLTNSAYFMTGSGLKYILAILNSKVADYYFFQITATIAGGRKRYTKQYVEQVPIPKISEEQQKPFEKIVNYILFLKKRNDMQEARIGAEYFELLLNNMVYELYFEDLVKKSGYEVIKYVEKLPTLTDESSMKEYLEVYNKIYKKDHPIRNSIAFIDSIPEIKEISKSFVDKDIPAEA